MRVRVAKWGNSLALRLPKAAAEALGARAGDEFQLLVENGKAELRPFTRIRRVALADLVAEMKRLGPENEPPFQDWGILPSEWPDEDWSDIAPSDEEMRASPRSGARRRA